MSEEKKAFTKENFSGKKNIAGVWIGRVLLYLFIALCLLIFAFNLYLNFCCVRVVVSQSSMMPTIMDGDVLYADKNAKATRGNIVVVDVSAYSENFQGDYIIKRLIATEGDSLYCLNNVIYIRYEGEEEYVPLEEPYLAEGAVTSSFAVVTVGEGEIFVMGDNRLHSSDSREVGCLQMEEISGVVNDWSIACKEIVTPWFNFWNSLFS